MIEAPNMRVEVLDALFESLESLYGKEYEEVLVDCLLYLKALESHPILAKQLAIEAEAKLDKMGRCPKCGEKYQIGHYNEWHGNEIGYEEMADKFCPNCDVPFEYDYVQEDD